MMKINANLFKNYCYTYKILGEDFRVGLIKRNKILFKMEKSTKK